MSNTLTRNENWVKEDPRIKEYLIIAKEYYKGPINFTRTCRKCYTAKLDPSKLRVGGACDVKEAYFDLNLSKKKNDSYKDFFFLRLIDGNCDVNNIKLF